MLFFVSKRWVDANMVLREEFAILMVYRLCVTEVQTVHNTELSLRLLKR